MPMHWTGEIEHEMSALVIALDVILAAIAIRYAIPAMADSTKTLAIIVVVIWKWERY